MYTFTQVAIFTAAIAFLALIRRLARPDPLRDIPGPWLAKYTSLLLAYHTRTGKRYLWIDGLHKKYGQHVRITPTQVSCSSPTAPAVIYAQGSSSLPKSPFYRSFYVDGTPSLFSTQDRHGHAQKRRVLAHPFSYASVRGLESWIRRSLVKFVRGLDRKCDMAGTDSGSGPGIGAETVGRAGGSATVDMLMWLNFLTFDVISDLAFGEPLGMLDRESDVLDDIAEEGKNGQTSTLVGKSSVERKDTSKSTGVAAMIDYRGRTAAFLGLFPFLLPGSPLGTLMRILKVQRWWPDKFVTRGLMGTETLSYIAHRCVRHRLAADTTRNERGEGDLLDRLVEGMRRHNSKTPASFSEKDDIEASSAQPWEEKGIKSWEDHVEVKEEDVITEAMLLLTAGSDTTANSTAAILYYMLKEDGVWNKVREEVERAMKDEELPELSEMALAGDGEMIPYFDQIKSLKYLQGTIDEGLRMFAVNAFGLPRIVPEGSVVNVDGVEFGEGTELSSPAYTIQHDPKIWGDPELFRPERWFEADASELKKHLMTFGMGPRACIGKNLAYVQIQLLIATIVLRYNMELSEPKGIQSVEGFMHKPVGVRVKISRRAI